LLAKATTEDALAQILPAQSADAVKKDMLAKAKELERLGCQVKWLEKEGKNL
jgi:hypothetical protein